MWLIISCCCFSVSTSNHILYELHTFLCHCNTTITIPVNFFTYSIFVGNARKFNKAFYLLRATLPLYIRGLCKAKINKKKMCACNVVFFLCFLDACKSCSRIVLNIHEKEIRFSLLFGCSVLALRHISELYCKIFSTKGKNIGDSWIMF